MIVAAALTVAALIAAVLALTSSTPRFLGIAIILGVILIWRRRNLHHW